MPPAPRAAMISYGPSLVPGLSAMRARHYSPGVASHRKRPLKASGQRAGPYDGTQSQSCRPGIEAGPGHFAVNVSRRGKNTIVKPVKSMLRSVRFLKGENL